MKYTMTLFRQLALVAALTAAVIATPLHAQ
jgi:hypothetical protein